MTTLIPRPNPFEKRTVETPTLEDSLSALSTSAAEILLAVQRGQAERITRDRTMPICVVSRWHSPICRRR
jgi:hypothetical protein